VKSVDVFGRIDRFQDALDVHLRGKRELNQNAVDVIVAVQVFDNGKHVEGAHRGWWRDEGTRESDFLAGGDFAFDVELRSRIVPHEDGCEARANPGGGEQADFVLQFGEELFANLCPVEDACGHAELAFAVRREIIAHAKNLEGHVVATIKLRI
jgi:hypothetical protein